MTQALTNAAATTETLAQFIAQHSKLLVLTGAGVSTRSGIPDYRDANGDWKRSAPMQYKDFVDNPSSRKRYWARSMIGWPRVGLAQPNRAHRALATLEAAGHIDTLVTQNVDRLHQRAGNSKVIDLHGRLDQVHCMEHDHVMTRDAYQALLVERNPAWTVHDATTAPDGDVDLDGVDFAEYNVVSCPDCGGVMKPRVVFYGESIPRATTLRANATLEDADALLVIGSSLMVFSGYRFARQMAQKGRPVAALNLGRTRADDLINMKVEADIGQTLQDVTRQISTR